MKSEDWNNRIKFDVIAGRIKETGEQESDREYVIEYEDMGGYKTSISFFDYHEKYILAKKDIVDEDMESVWYYEFYPDDFEFDLFIDCFANPFKFLWEDLIDD